MTKKILKNVVQQILTWESKLVLRKYRPKLIGVTGNVGKTSTKEAIASVLATKYTVRKSLKSYNSELGVPLTILDQQTAWTSVTGWLKVIFHGFTLILTKCDYPEWLVLEVGADRPGDIKSIVKWIKFDIAVVTRLPDVPVHIEFFKSKQEVIAEKMSLPISIKPDGLVIFNIDDENIVSWREKIKAKVITYGFQPEADVRASNDHIMYEGEGTESRPVGFAFKLDSGGSNAPVRVSGTIGMHLVYPVLASIALGTHEGVNLVSAIETLSKHVPPPGRLRLLEGIKGSSILDDTYNASPAAFEAALETLGQVQVPGRKIVAIGDMMELGTHTAAEHKRIGVLSSKICDYILTVGVRARFSHEAALEAGFDQEKICHFDSSREAGKYLQNLIEKGDIVLVKGSQSARMERTVEEIMAEPDKKEKLLVRQEHEWQNR